MTNIHIATNKGRSYSRIQYDSIQTEIVHKVPGDFDPITDSGNLSREKTFVNFAVSGQFTKVLTAKLFIEYGGVIINGHVTILDNGDSVGIMDVASHSMARQYLPNSSFSNCHVDTVASSSCSHQFNLV